MSNNINVIRGNDAFRFHVTNSLLAKRVTLITALPGVGKSEIMADCMRWLFNNDGVSRKLHTFYVSQYEDIDFMPMPFVHPQSGVFDYKTPPLLEQIMANDVVIWEEATMQGCNRIMLQATTGDRMSIGSWSAPDNVAQVMIGNTADSGNFEHIQNPVASNRIKILEWWPDVNDWLKEYAIPNLLHPMTIAYIKMEGESALLDWDSARTRNATPRSHTNAAFELTIAENESGGTLDNGRKMEIMAGYLPDEHALKMQALFALQDKIVPFSVISTQPDTAPIPDNPAALFMTLATVARRTCPQTWEKVMGYVIRLPLELQGSVVEPVIKQHTILTSTDEFQNYTIRTAPLVA
jgi:hypothetical protein